MYLPSIVDKAAEYLLENESIGIDTGGSYVFMLKHQTAVPIECYVQNEAHNYSIELFKRGVALTPLSNDSYSIQPRADGTDAMTSLGNEICGFKVDSATLSFTWKMHFIDQARNTYYATKSITIRPIFPRHIVNYKKIGESFFVHCVETQDSQFGNLLQCKLFNPQNQLIIQSTTDCNYEVENSTISSFGSWRCLIFYTSNMLPNEITYEYIPKGTDIVHTWTNVTDNVVNIGCTVINATQKFIKPNKENDYYCMMVRPDGYQFVLQRSLATKRYTAFETNLTKPVCALQIVLPLEESEKGLWRCEQHGKNSIDAGPIGGFVNVSAETSIHKPEAKLPTGVFAHINTTLSLKCQVTFSSPYCYMRGPDGFMYPLNNYRKTSLGLCDFIKEEAQITDNGTWMCGFGMQTGEPDAVFTFQVHIPEPIPIQPEEQEIEARTAGIARIGCTTKGLGDYPLKYCRFLSPDGKMYHIENHQTSDRISYEGRGLEYGDCGIILQDVNESDKGTWSCITRLEHTEEVYTNIHLDVNDNLSIASTLGISFGVAAIVIISTVFFLHRYQKRRNYQTTFNNSATGARVSQDSSGNDNQDIVFSVLQDNAGTRNYNTTDVVERFESGNINNPFGSGSESDSNVVYDVMDDTTQQRR